MVRHLGLDKLDQRHRRGVAVAHAQLEIRVYPPGAASNRGAMTSKSFVVAGAWSIFDMTRLRWCCESSRAMVTSFSTTGRSDLALASVVVSRS